MSGSLVLGDWGNTRLRLWRLEGDEVTGRQTGPGIAANPDPAEALLASLGDWPVERVVLCGMAGARSGLREVPYLPCPASHGDWASAALETGIGERSIAIAAGLSCRSVQGRPDVMRGEETQIFGTMVLDPDLASGTRWVLLPGTHSKWARLSEGAITGFRTFMTGELFALLGGSSLVLAGSPEGDGEDAGFSAGLDRALGGAGLTGSLFEARSAQLIDGRTAGWARGFVSGLLIGAEIAEMAPQGTVTVIGEPALAAHYAAALRHYGAEPALLDAEACAIAGLRLIDAH